MLRRQYRPSLKLSAVPEVLASHLFNSLENQFSRFNYGPPFFSPQNADLGPFQPWELDDALRRVKPRPSKHAPAIFKTFLLSHFTQAFLRAESPDYWRIARIVMLLKVDSKTPSLHHPIVAFVSQIPHDACGVDCQLVVLTAFPASTLS